MADRNQLWRSVITEYVRVSSHYCFIYYHCSESPETNNFVQRSLYLQFPKITVNVCVRLILGCAL